MSYSASISTSGSININVSVAGNGANVATDNIKIISTCPAGYTVSISGPTDTALYKDGDITSSPKIRPTSGTKENPLTIIGPNIGTWGYSTVSNTPTGTFIGLTDVITEIQTKSIGSDDNGDIFPVYYGASVDLTFEPGLYRMSDNNSSSAITYYLTTDLSCSSYQIEFNPTSISGGVSLTGTGTMPNQVVTTGDTVSLDANQFSPPPGYIFDGWNTAADGSGTKYTDKEQITDLASAGGTITLYAQWVKIVNIQYNGNGATGTTTMSVKHLNLRLGDNVDLFPSNFSRSGYGFAGWSTNPNAGSNLNSSKVYGPMENITIDPSFMNLADAFGNVTFYAVWIASSGDMQDWMFGCSTLNRGEVTAMRDVRDGNVYAVAKLADDACWMIENLRLGSSAELSNLNTSSPSLPLVNIYSSNTTSNYLSASSNSWCYDDAASCVNQSRLDDGNTVNSVADMTNANQNIFSYGNYYNWYSATAGNGVYASGYLEQTSGSICPSGWHLPTGGDGRQINDFGVLTKALGGKTSTMDQSTIPTGTEMSRILRTYPNNFIFSGGSNTGKGTGWSFWSNTAINTAEVFSFHFGYSVLDPAVMKNTDSYFKHGKRTVRCVTFF